MLKPQSHNKLTYKRKQFAKKYIEHHGNATQAALEVYDGSYDSAQVLGSRNANNPVIMEEIDKLLKKKGLNNDEWIAGNLKHAVESGIGQKATNADAIKVLDMLLKVKSSYPNKVNKNINLNINQNLGQTNVDVVTKDLKELNNTTQSILGDLQS